MMYVSVNQKAVSLNLHRYTEGPAPGGTALVSMAQAGNKIMGKFFQDSGDPFWSKRGIGFEEEYQLPGEEEALTVGALMS
jgi:hypothetical protein